MSPHRMKRPWKGQTEKTAEDVNPGHDPQNPLSPGGVRAGGKVYFFQVHNPFGMEAIDR